jgi:hypothetical protein
MEKKMTLVDIWNSSKMQLEGKKVSQIITFAGEGKLRDGNDTSIEFREFLSHLPSGILCEYVDQCISESFTNSGFVLQDTINQLGKRLGFDVEDGRYRGTSKSVGFDGLWKFPDGHSLIVEVKTTDAYRINLDVIVGYQKKLTSLGVVGEYKSSVLIVVGRADTGDLEAQIRGSRHAWDVRLISVDALVELVRLKEEVEDPEIIEKIYTILIPREYTKLDEIIGIVFSTAEEIKGEEIVDEVEMDEHKDDTKKVKPVSFNDACITKIGNIQEVSFIKRSRVRVCPEIT